MRRHGVQERSVAGERPDDTVVGTAGPVRIPAMYCPISPAIYPSDKGIGECSVDFLTRFGLGSDDEHRARLAAGIHDVAGRVAPFGDDSVRQLISDLIIWFLAFDDLCDESPLGTHSAELMVMIGRLQRTIEAPEFPIDENPYARALRDIRLRMGVIATPAQVKRWVETMRGHFLAETCKAANVAANVSPGLSDYAAIRLYAAGGMTVVVLADLCNNIDLPATMWEDRRIRALTEMAASIAVWDSDIFSYPKECHRSADHHNLVDIVATTYQYTPQQAIAAAVALRDRVMCRFLSLSAETTALHDNPLVARYLLGLGHYIRGALDWTMTTSRYKYLDGRDQGDLAFHSMGFRNTPSDDCPDPLPIPSIAWWWEIGECPLAPFEIPGPISEPSS